MKPTGHRCGICDGHVVHATVPGDRVVFACWTCDMMDLWPTVRQVLSPKERDQIARRTHADTR